MSQIERKWIADKAIDPSKLDDSATFTMAGVQTTGPIGINTNSPQDDLHVRDTAGTAGIRLDMDDGALGRAYGINSDANGSLNIKDEDAIQTRVTVTSAGKVGVGTTTPVGEIHVSGATAGIDLQNTLGRDWRVNSDQAGHLNIIDVANATRVTVDDNGRVGIGTTNPAGVNEHIYDANNASLRLQAGSGRSYDMSSTSAGAFVLQDSVAGATRLTVASTGVLTVAQDTNLSKNLYVTGDTTMTGGLAVNGTTTVINKQVIVSDRMVINGDGDGTALTVTQMGAKRAVAIENSGTAASLTIDAGFVGIGTTNPGVDLDVNVSRNSGTNIWVTNANTGTNARAALLATDGARQAILMQYGANRAMDHGGQTAGGMAVVASSGSNGLVVCADNAAPLYLGTNNATRMTFTPSGLVGIGTTDPQTHFEFYATSEYFVRLNQPTASASASFQARMADSTAVTVTQYGSSMAGTEVGLAKAGMSRIVSSGSSLLMYTSEAANIYFATNGTPRMVILSTGNVGLGGTLAPTATLEVAGTFKVSGTGSVTASSLQLASGTSVNNIDTNTSLGSSNFTVPTQLAVKTYVDNATGAVSTWLRNTGSGFLFPATVADKVGIGTNSVTSGLQMEVSGPLGVIGNGSNNNMRICNSLSGTTSSDGMGLGVEGANGVDSYVYNHENGYLRLGTNATERLRIDAAGLIGVGTDTPLSKLHIVAPAATHGLRVYGSAAEWTAYIIGNTPAGQSSGLLIDAGTNSSDGALRVRNRAGTDYLLVQGDGKVGIGNAAPDGILQILATPHASPSPTYSQFFAGTLTQMFRDAADDSYILGNAYYNADDLYHYVRNGGATSVDFNAANHSEIRFLNAPTGTAGAVSTLTVRMVIKADGKVGIGTDAPLSTLNVVGTHTSGYGVATVRSDNDAYLCLIASAANAGVRLQTTPGTDLWSIGSGGSIGGTAPDALKFMTNTTVRAVITQAGNVGIGSATPTVALDVAGDIKGSGNIQGISVSTTAISATSLYGLFLGGSTISICGSLVPSGSQNVGAPANRWSTIYAGTVNANTGLTGGAISGTSLTVTSSGAIYTDKIFSSDSGNTWAINGSGAITGASLNVSGNVQGISVSTTAISATSIYGLFLGGSTISICGNLAPSGSQNIGAPANRWSTIYAGTVNANSGLTGGAISGTSLTVTSPGAIYADKIFSSDSGNTWAITTVGAITGSSLNVSGNVQGISVTTTAISASSIYGLFLGGSTVSICGDLAPSASLTYKCGSTSLRWAGVFSSTINLSNSASTPSDPIGSNVVVYWDSASTSLKMRKGGGQTTTISISGWA